jgi:hypothetical protein
LNGGGEHFLAPIALSAADLGMLGCYLYGRRWQTALARELPVDPRLVRRWAAGERPVSTRYAAVIIALVSARHRRRLAALHAHFLAMVDSLGSPEVRLALLGYADPAGDG